MSVTNIRICTAILAGVTLACIAAGDPVDGVYFDLPDCDNHGVLSSTEELGDPTVFSPTQHIDHVATFTQESACPPTDIAGVANALVIITNLTGRAWEDLYYVGDPSTTFTNVDGAANQGIFPDLRGLAFRIDSVGLNRPLVFESIAFNGIFEPGETWQFIVQDYAHPAGLAPDSFFSIGYADGSVAIIETSAASIVQFVPSPASLAVLALGGALTLIRRRG